MPRLPMLPTGQLPLWALLALAGGYFSRHHPAWGTALLLAGAGAAASGLLAPRARMAAGLALLLTATAGWRAAPAPHLPATRAEAARYQGVIREDTRRTAAGLRAVIDLEARAVAAPGPWQSAGGRVLLQVRGLPEPPPGRGDRVVFRGRLRRPGGLRNPGREGYRRHLERQGIAAAVTVRWPGEVLFAAPAPGVNPLEGWRRGTAAALQEAVPGRAGAVLRALALGDRSALGPDLLAGFRSAGTSHLLAISGFHLGVLAMLLAPLAGALLVRVPLLPLACPIPPLARAATLPALVAYAAMSGFQVSTLRALAMTGVFLLGSAAATRLAPVTVLAATALLLALPHPAVLADPGFQLSLTALAGLFWLAPHLERRLFPGRSSALQRLAPGGPLQRAGRAGWRALGRGACVSLAASLFTMPVAVFHFGSASLLGVLLNPLAVPLVGLFCLPLALAGCAVHAAAPAAAAPLWRLAGWGIDALVVVQDRLAGGAPALAWRVLETPWGLLGSACLLGWLCLRVSGARWPARGTGALLAAAALSLSLPGLARWAEVRLDPRVHLWVLDVGQGQALALRFPGDRWALVDAGGFPDSEFDVGAQVVVPALEALGARHLWGLVSTHPHPDHLGGAAALLEWGRPEVLWLPGGFSGDTRYRDLEEQARRLGTRVAWAAPGPLASLGAAQLDAAWLPAADDNGRSLALKVTLGDQCALLPADLGSEQLDRLSETGFAAGCAVVVAPHHGSAGSASRAFLHGARPRVVLASAAGHRGLPAEGFREAVAAAGAAFASTHSEGCLHAWLGPAGVGWEAVTR